MQNNLFLKITRMLRQTLQIAISIVIIIIVSYGLGVTSAQHMEPPSSIPVYPIFFDAVYVVNGGDGMNASISVIDTITNSVQRTITLTNAKWPHHIYMSRDGKRLAVAIPGVDLSGGHTGGHPHHAMGAVMILDAKTGKTIKSRLLPTVNHNAIYSPNQREIWTSQMIPNAPGSVLILDANTLETIQEIQVGHGPGEITFSPGGTQAQVANNHSNTISVINPRTKILFQTLSVVGTTPVVPSQAINGRTYIDCELSKSVSVIDRLHNNVEFTYTLDFTPNFALLGPDGHVWITDADNGRVVLYDPDADIQKHTIQVGAGAHAIAFSRNGTYGYITNQHENTVSVIHVQTRTIIKTLSVGEKPNGMLFRPITFLP